MERRGDDAAVDGCMVAFVVAAEIIGGAVLAFYLGLRRWGRELSWSGDGHTGPLPPDHVAALWLGGCASALALIGVALLRSGRPYSGVVHLVLAGVPALAACASW
ncbi:hypothetical protein G3I40_18020 [Streptomyces sp. SID14478]|uniref:hypothetical protein n=1 Tax=Streptomyces sp. SID14478 TaxID=2706073 RepID=UPI0013DA2A5B|nr:hypothetical protein [Streptomyces sp. SID14478]NEB77103.1 hypothetical protein [Streptomyces sp. SID14478]